ncbi:MAG: hypothetical protein WB567_08550 [Terracidiphilus sp.]
MGLRARWDYWKLMVTVTLIVWPAMKDWAGVSVVPVKYCGLLGAICVQAATVTVG